MITVEEKLKAFSQSIIDEVQRDSNNKIHEFTERSSKLLEEERSTVLKEAESIIEEIKSRAESEKAQIISKAQIERERALLMKRNEIFEKVIQDIRNMCAEYSSLKEHENFLDICLNAGLAQINDKEAVVILKADDLERYRDHIAGYINKNWAGRVSVLLEGTDKEILGGCIVENKSRTKRIDCSMAALIDDNLEMSGRILMNNLQ